MEYKGIYGDNLSDLKLADQARTVMFRLLSHQPLGLSDTLTTMRLTIEAKLDRAMMASWFIKKAPLAASCNSVLDFMNSFYRDEGWRIPIPPNHAPTGRPPKYLK